MPSRCIQHRLVAEDERPGVIGFDEPFGERLVAHLVEPSQRDDDVGERLFTERRQLTECFQP